MKLKGAKTAAQIIARSRAPYRHCSKCGDARRVLERTVNHTQLRIVEFHKICSVCNWVVEVDTRPVL